MREILLYVPSLSGVEEGTRKGQTMTRGTARHVSLFGIRGTLACVFQGPVLGKKLTRTKEKDPEQVRGEAECSKHRGPEREPAGSFLGGLGSSGDCWQVDRQLLFPAQAVLMCVCVCP